MGVEEIGDGGGKEGTGDWPGEAEEEDGDASAARNDAAPAMLSAGDGAASEMVRGLGIIHLAGIVEGGGVCGGRRR